MARTHGNNRHHKFPRAQGGTDNYPPNSIAIVPVWRHNLWNIAFNGHEQINSVFSKLKVFLKTKGIDVRLEKT